MDVYVWVEPSRRPDEVAGFVHRYVDVQDPGDARLEAFLRVWVDGGATAADQEAMAALRRGPGGGRAVSLYVRARDHHEAIITVTEEGAAVLGLSLDDPDDSPATIDQAAGLLAQLRAEFAASHGVIGIELPPPQSWDEWAEAEVILRVEQAGPATPVM